MLQVKPAQEPYPDVPTCVACITERGFSDPLPLKTLNITVEIHISTAFVTVTGIFCNTSRSGDRMLVLPLDEDCSIINSSVVVGDRLIETIVIPTDEENNIVVAKPRKGRNPYFQGELQMPTMFRLPVTNVGKGEDILFEITYTQALIYCEGSYEIVVPNKIPSSYFFAPMPVEKLVGIRVHINTVTPDTEWGSSSHPLKTIAKGTSQITMEADAAVTWENVDFQLNYSIGHSKLLANVLVEIDPDTQTAQGNPEGNFVLCINPPPSEKLVSSFGRSIVFLLDKSHSMKGEPMEAAKKAIHAALGMLKPADKFTIFAFDTDTIRFANSNDLGQVTEDRLQQARMFVNELSAGGGTNIRNPMTAAFNAIYANRSDLNYIFLITDGCVGDERAICQEAKLVLQRLPVRICTFGIGNFCNKYFLKLLAEIGRGYSDTALHCSNIYPRMVRLIQMAERPLLTEVQIGFEGLDDVEIYPFPVPDIFCDRPLVVSGRFSGKMPSFAVLHARYSSGTILEQRIATTTSQTIPIGKVFAKQRIEMLTARSWFLGDEGGQEMKEKAIDLSCQFELACAYTQIFAYESTRQVKLQTEQEMARKAMDAAELEDMAKGKKKSFRKWAKTRKGRMVIAATSATSVGLIAAGVVFGSLMGTAANTDIFSEVDKGVSALAACAECCDGCDC